MAIYYQRLGKNICKHRKRKKYSQKVLAEKVNCPPEQISRYENGKRHLTLDMLNEICEQLDVSYEEILSGATDARISSDDSGSSPSWAAEEFLRITAGCSDEAIRRLLEICDEVLSMPRR